MYQVTELNVDRQWAARQIFHVSLRQILPCQNYPFRQAGILSCRFRRRRPLRVSNSRRSYRESNGRQRPSPPAVALLSVLCEDRRAVSVVVLRGDAAHGTGAAPPRHPEAPVHPQHRRSWQHVVFPTAADLLLSRRRSTPCFSW